MHRAACMHFSINLQSSKAFSGWTLQEMGQLKCPPFLNQLVNTIITSIGIMVWWWWIATKWQAALIQKFLYGLMASIETVISPTYHKM